MATYNSKKFIDIGGVVYSRRAKLNWWVIDIVGYDINTERHLIVKDMSGEQSRIELDNDKLLLRERYTRTFK